MFFRILLPDLESHLIKIKDRLARDQSNEVLRSFVAISEIILVEYYKDAPTQTQLAQEATRLIHKADKINEKELIDAYYPFKEELEFYLYNKKEIDSLRVYIEAATSVDNVAKDFFRKDQSS